MPNHLVEDNRQTNNRSDLDEMEFQLAVKTMRIEAAASLHKSPFRPKRFAFDFAIFTTAPAGGLKN
jgi:hypothetical protein